MMVLLLQAHKVIQGTAKHAHDIMLHEGVGIRVGRLETIGISLVDFAEELHALTNSRSLPLTGLLCRSSL